MKKVLVNYKGAIVLYLVVFFGVLLVSTRFEKLNQPQEEVGVVALNH